MDNYDGVNNSSWGTHTVEIVFQMGKFQGVMTYKIHGTGRGLEVLLCGGMYGLDHIETAKTKGMSILHIASGLFGIFLYSEDGDNEYIVIKEDELAKMIVSMRIIDFKENSHD